MKTADTKRTSDENLSQFEDQSNCKKLVRGQSRVCYQWLKILLLPSHYILPLPLRLSGHQPQRARPRSTLPPAHPSSCPPAAHPVDPTSRSPYHPPPCTPPPPPSPCPPFMPWDIPPGLDAPRSRRSPTRGPVAHPRRGRAARRGVQRCTLCVDRAGAGGEAGGGGRGDRDGVT